MARVLIVSSTYPRWDGDSTPPFVSGFAQALQDVAGLEVVVLAPHHAGAARHETLSGVDVRRFVYWRPLRGQDVVYGGGGLAKRRRGLLYSLKLLSFVGAEFLSVLRAVRAEQIAVVNAHWLVPQGFVAVLVKRFVGVPVVVTIHGSDIFGLKTAFYRRIKRWVLRNADVVVVNSSATLEAAMNLHERDYVVCPMGVDTARFSPPAARAAGRTTRLITVGRLIEVKGLIYACIAARAIIEDSRHLPFHLFIVGDGPERGRLEQYVMENGLQDHVTFTGWIGHEELPRWYAESDIYVGASVDAEDGTREAFGLAIAEAQACALPVIATRTGGIEDVVLDGETGLLVDQRSAGQLAGAITRILADNDLGAELGARGAERVRERFSWSTVASTYGEVFARLTGS